MRTSVEVPDYSQLGDDGLPLCMTVELNPKKDFKDNAKLCFKQARLNPATGCHRGTIHSLPNLSWLRRRAGNVRFGDGALN